MIDFSKEHPEVVRLMAGWMQDELIKTKKELAEARAEAEKKKQLALQFKDKLLVFRKLIFGQSSEKRAGHRPRGDEDAELLLFSQNLLPPLKDKQVEKLPESITDRKSSTCPTF